MARAEAEALRDDKKALKADLETLSKVCVCVCVRGVCAWRACVRSYRLSCRQCLDDVTEMWNAGLAQVPLAGETATEKQRVRVWPV